MFCFVDHRKLMTSAKIMDSLGRSRSFMSVSSKNALRSRLTQLGEEHL